MLFINTALKSIIPAICTFALYKINKTKDIRKVVDNIEWIIEGAYPKLQYSNFLGVSLKCISAERTSVGYIVIFKIPVGFDTERLRNLNETLDKNNYEYIHYTKVYKNGKHNDINSRYLRIQVLEKNKLNEYVATHK